MRPADTETRPEVAPPLRLSLEPKAPEASVSCEGNSGWVDLDPARKMHEPAAAEGKQAFGKEDELDPLGAPHLGRSAFKWGAGALMRWGRRLWIAVGRRCD